MYPCSGILDLDSSVIKCILFDIRSCYFVVTFLLYSSLMMDNRRNCLCDNIFPVALSISILQWRLIYFEVQKAVLI